MKSRWDWLLRSPDRKCIQPGGTYYADDLQPAMLARVEGKVAAQKVTNIKTIVGTQTDPRPPRGTLDYVLMVDVYHELSQPQIILRNIAAAALKPRWQACTDRIPKGGS